MPGGGAGRDVVYWPGGGRSGRGAGWAVPLCGGANVRSYRGPLIQGGGFAWCQNAGVGIALPESLAQETAKVRDWIAADTRRRRPWLCGFSNGAAMAANLLIETPEAYAGLIMIGSCFAVEDDALSAGALAGKQVLVCRGRSDCIMPRHKFEQAESTLTGSNGGRTTTLGYDGGHDLPPQ